MEAAMNTDRRMNATLDRFSPIEVGERLRIARDAAKLTQAAAATSANMARTTLVAIEQGQRKLRMDELQRLSKLYGTSVNALFRQESVHVDLTPRFRKLPGSSDTQAIEAAARLLTDLAKAEAELEDLLGIRRVRNYPQQRPILPGDIYTQAEQDALEVRQWLGLGLGPIQDVPILLEAQLGVRVFVRRLSPQISALYTFDEAVGACMLFHAGHPRSRRNMTAAHELGHLITTRDEPEVVLDNTPEQARDERYANAFARGFLTPARSVMQTFGQVTAGSSHLSRRHVIVMAHSFAVSREAMVRRLEELKLAKPGTWDWFEAHGGITDIQARQVLGDASFEATYGTQTNLPMSLYLNALAAEAWKQDLLSEGQLARLLQLDRVELRTMLDSLDAGWTETDEALALHG
jgi:Zn-dependent peptidase ImmA (M78 family)/transcriptional regulator with XRE-family HTH domain